MLHSFWLWVYYNAPTIQSVAAVAAFFGLVVYALETSKIRTATLAQSDASRRPYFHAEEWANTRQETAFIGKDYYQFMNCGAGIALNMKWRFLKDSAAPLVVLGSCAVGRVKYLFTVDGRWIEYREIESNGGVYLEYEDTARKRYWTTVTIVPMADKTTYANVDTGSVPKKL